MCDEEQSATAQRLAVATKGRADAKRNWILLVSSILSIAAGFSTILLITVTGPWFGFGGPIHMIIDYPWIYYGLGLLPEPLRIWEFHYLMFLSPVLTPLVRLPDPLNSLILDSLFALLGTALVVTNIRHIRRTGGFRWGALRDIAPAQRLRYWLGVLPGVLLLVTLGFVAVLAALALLAFASGLARDFRKEARVSEIRRGVSDGIQDAARKL